MRLKVRFTSTELAELNAAVSAIEIRGARLPEQVLAFSGVEAAPEEVAMLCNECWEEAARSRFSGR